MDKTKKNGNTQNIGNKEIQRPNTDASLFQHVNKRYPFTISKIDENLYLGSVVALNFVDFLKDCQQWFVLSVMDSPPTAKCVTQIKINVYDSPDVDLLSWFTITNNIIKNALYNKNKVLIHCMAGISRSATIMCAYIMKEKSLKLKDALEYLRKRRVIINPNSGFMAQLKIYEGTLF